MTDTTNTRTPQPGDVWDSPAGLVYCISHFVGPVLIPMGSGNTSYGARVESIHLSTSGMTYLGRASDLIGEALAWREAKAMLGDAPAKREGPKGLMIRGDHLMRDITPDDKVYWGGRRCAVFDVVTQLEDEDTGEGVDVYKIVTYSGDDKLATLAELKVWVEDPKETPND